MAIPADMTEEEMHDLWNTYKAGKRDALRAYYDALDVLYGTDGFAYPQKHDDATMEALDAGIHAKKMSRLCDEFEDALELPRSL